jgi:hypothetical protein
LPGHRAHCDRQKRLAAHAERIGRPGHDERHEDEFQHDRQQRQRAGSQRIRNLQPRAHHDEAEAERGAGDEFRCLHERRIDVDARDIDRDAEHRADDHRVRDDLLRKGLQAARAAAEPHEHADVVEVNRDDDQRRDERDQRQAVRPVELLGDRERDEGVPARRGLEHGRIGRGRDVRRTKQRPAEEEHQRDGRERADGTESNRSRREARKLRLGQRREEQAGEEDIEAELFEPVPHVAVDLPPALEQRPQHDEQEDGEDAFENGEHGTGSVAGVVPAHSTPELAWQAPASRRGRGSGPRPCGY